MRGRDLLTMGAYVPGTDPDFDAAIRLWPKIQAFLQQDAGNVFNFADSAKLLLEIAGESQ
jgi:flagellum-specific ATP synthase